MKSEKKSFSAKDHSFMVCAYRESPYLEECIQSLLSQSVHSQIQICTSTPNEHIRAAAEKYGLNVNVNPVSNGIASDWNYAVAMASTPLVTLAHQDDFYEPDFLKETLKALNSGGQSLISFTDYYEIQGDRRVYARDFLNLRIKQILLFPMRFRPFQRNCWIRRRILSIGDPIGCPSVTYVKDNLTLPIFEAKYRAALDWQTWERISRENGRFTYIHRTLMGHRMHPDSTTVRMIGEGNRRTQEDMDMFRKFWPEPIAKIICRLYSNSQKYRRKKS